MKMIKLSFKDCVFYFPLKIIKNRGFPIGIDLEGILSTSYFYVFSSDFSNVKSKEMEELFAAILILDEDNRCLYKNYFNRLVDLGINYHGSIEYYGYYLNGVYNINGYNKVFEILNSEEMYVKRDDKTKLERIQEFNDNLLDVVYKLIEVLDRCYHYCNKPCNKIIEQDKLDYIYNFFCDDSRNVNDQIELAYKYVNINSGSDSGSDYDSD